MKTKYIYKTNNKISNDDENLRMNECSFILKNVNLVLYNKNRNLKYINKSFCFWYLLMSTECFNFTNKLIVHVYLVLGTTRVIEEEELA